MGAVLEARLGDYLLLQPSLVVDSPCVDVRVWFRVRLFPAHQDEAILCWMENYYLADENGSDWFSQGFQRN